MKKTVNIGEKVWKGGGCEKRREERCKRSRRGRGWRNRGGVVRGWIKIRRRRSRRRKRVKRRRR